MDESYNNVDACSADVTEEESAVCNETDTPEADNPAEETEHTEGPSEADTVDYESLIAEDLALLRSEFPELKNVSDITELNNPLRYAALRDLGLSPTEAYLATAKRPSQDTRAHLKSAHGRSMTPPVNMMTQSELATARELFPGMNDAQIQQLYKRVTK